MCTCEPRFKCRHCIGRSAQATTLGDMIDGVKAKAPINQLRDASRDLLRDKLKVDRRAIAVRRRNIADRSERLRNDIADIEEMISEDDRLSSALFQDEVALTKCIIALGID